MTRAPLSLLALTLGCASPSGDTGDTGPSAPPPTAHWMADVLPDGDALLGELLLPGAFNSSSYACDAAYGMSPDAPEVVQAMWASGEEENQALVVEWAKTQDRDLTQQLEDGIRWMEINVTLKDGVVTTWHSVYGLPVGELLEQLVAYATAWPEEVVVVHFGVSMDSADWPLLLDELTAPRVEGLSFCDLVHDGDQPAALTSLSAVRGSGRNLVWTPDGELRTFLEEDGGCPLSTGGVDRAWSITVTPEGVEEALAASLETRDPERLLINDFVFSLSGADSPLDQASYLSSYDGVQEISEALGFSGGFPGELIDRYGLEAGMNVFAGAYYQDTDLVEAAIAANGGR